MRICVVRNPKSGSADDGAALRALLAEHPACELRETAAPGDARRIAAGARSEGFDVVLAAGGDGTVSEVVDGVSSEAGKIAVGILPLGTGNDLARSLGLPLDPAAALREALEGRERQVDLIHALDDEGKATYVANSAVGGFGGELEHGMVINPKARLGALAYLVGAIRALPTLAPHRVCLKWNDALSEEIDALNVVVANGKTVAGGWSVAPDADLEDGLLDVVVIRAGSPMDLGILATRFAATGRLEGDLVLHRRARAVQITSSPAMCFNADGDVLTSRPVSFTVIPKALRALVGRDYAREAGVGGGLLGPPRPSPRCNAGP